MYRVITEDNAMMAVDALPIEALAGYLGVLEVLELTPWNGAPINDSNPDSAVRQLVFGRGGDGLMTYLVLRDDQLDALPGLARTGPAARNTQGDEYLTGTEISR